MHPRHDATAWCYVSGWVSVLETQLLGEEVYRSLLEARNPETAWGVLSKTGYRAHFGGPEDLRDFEQALQRFSVEQRVALRALCPDPGLVAFFDFDRQYRAERARWTGSREEGAEAASLLPVEGFLQAFPEIGRPPFVEEYEAAFAAALGGARSLPKGAFSALLDSLYLSLLLSWGRQWSGTLIQEYVERYVQVKVVEMVLRSVHRRMDVRQLDQVLFLGPLRTDAVAAFLGGEEISDSLNLVETLLPSGFPLSAAEVTSSLEAFQRAAERFLLEAIEPARYVVFGPERAFGYLCGLRNQEINVRFCLSAVLYSLDSRSIGERLRPIYV